MQFVTTMTTTSAMTETPEATPVPLRVAGLSLIFSPIAGLAGSLMLPSYAQGMSGELAFIDAHPTRWLGGMSLDLLFSLLLIPAGTGIVRATRGRSRLGQVAGAMVAAAGFVHGAMLGYQLPEASLVAHMADRAQAVALAEASYDSPAFTMLVIPFVALMFPGLLLAAAALWRSRVVPLWAAGSIAAAVAIEVAGPPAVKASLMFALLALGLGRAGVSLLQCRRPASPPSPPAASASAAG
jgi:hypothetical protein